MYQVLCRSSERPWATHVLAATPPATGLPVPDNAPLILHMRENRSHLSAEARLAFSALGLMLMCLSIIPALAGHWLVPVFALAAMGGLTFALERHAATPAATETLEHCGMVLRHRDRTGRTTDLPTAGTRLDARATGNGELRLFLVGPRSRIEIGLCLAPEERREIAPLIAAALAGARHA